MANKLREEEMGTNLLLVRMFGNGDEHRRYLLRVCGLLCLGLLLTGSAAYALSNYRDVITVMFFTKIVGIDSFWLFMVVEIALALFLYSAVLHVPAIVGYFMFFGYALLIGVLVSPIFLIYRHDSILLVFGYSGLLFFICALLGLVCAFDFSKIRSVLLSALLTLIVAGVANAALFKLDAFDWFLSFVGVIVFSVLIAYDTNKLNEINERGNEASTQEHKEVIKGTLILYIDFMNVFLRLLSLFGKKK